MSNIKSLPTCLCCGSNNLELVFDLGKQPLANSFKATATEAVKVRKPKKVTPAIKKAAVKKKAAVAKKAAKKVVKKATKK